MSKIIKITNEYLEKCVEEFKEILSKGKLSDGKINYTKNFEDVERKATISFTEDAWIKMQSLVMSCKKEVGWHGIAKRGDEVDSYIISDILVYPQEVTGATVTPDQSEYETWLMSHDDDVFNNIRMQGHSHVDFAVTPSPVDLGLYERILDQLDDDMFYIFLIFNKKGEKTIKIYDMRENMLFETKDININIIKNENSILDFLENAMELVVEKKTTYSPHSQYGGVNQYTPPSYNSKQKSETSYDKKNESKSETRLGKRAGKDDKKYQGGYGYGSGYYGGDYYDDYRLEDEYYERMYGIK